MPVLVVGAAGAVAGGVNALHAFWLLPLLDGAADLKWHVVPAGVAHGGLLAATSVCAALLTGDRPLWQRLACVPASGWIAGVLAWVPLGASTGLHGSVDAPLAMVTSPFMEMGLVASLAYAGWAFGGRLRSWQLCGHLAIGVAAGVLGSAPWWIGWEEWQALRFFPLHGATWGALVGVATWRMARAPSRPA